MISKKTNINRYILDFKVIPVFVVCIYAFVLFVSPFGVRAQSDDPLPIIDNLVQVRGSENIYLVRDFRDGRVFKRLIHKDAIKFYPWLRDKRVNALSLNQFDIQYNNKDVPTVDSVNDRSDELFENYEQEIRLYRIGIENGKQTIKRLLMNSEVAAFQSGYKHAAVFQLDRREIDLYAQGDPIYFTGKVSWEGNVYRKTDSLTADERGTRIYRTIIPQGENRCTITGDVIAVVGKPGVEHHLIKSTRYTSLNSTKGGNVTIYIQAINLNNQTPSFTLECEQESPLNVHTIDTSTLPEPEITFTHSGAGEQTFTMELGPGYHYCSVQDKNGNTFNPSQKNLIIVKDVDKNKKFPLNSTIVGDKTYNIRISVRRFSSKASYTPDFSSPSWTIQCHTPQTITLQPDILNRITGVGHPSGFRLNWTPNTKYIFCRESSRYNNRGGANLNVVSKDSHKMVSRNNALPGTNNNSVYYDRVFLNIDVSAFSGDSQSAEWTAVCITEDEIPWSSRKNTNYFNVFITGSETRPHPTNKNPNLLRNVVAQADGVRCANHLLELEDVIADVLLVPEDLCIQYGTVDIFWASGLYFPSTKTIYMKTSPFLENEEHFYELRQQLQRTLIHELCHAQQDYYANSTMHWRYLTQKFANVTEHQWEELGENSFGWYYPSTGEYYGMYGAGWSPQKSTQYDILETGAEFCAAFAFANAGQLEQAEKIVGTGNSNKMLNNVINNPKAKTWISQYMLNPNLEPFFISNPIRNISIQNVQITDIEVTQTSIIPEEHLLSTPDIFTYASLTVPLDHQPILPTQLHKAGDGPSKDGPYWTVRYRISMAANDKTLIYQQRGIIYQQDGTPSVRLKNVPVFGNYQDRGLRVRYRLPRSGTIKQELIITPRLTADVILSEGGPYTAPLLQYQTRQEIDLYQLLIDRGLLNENGSLPDE